MWKRLTGARFLTWFLVAAGLFLRVWHYAVDHTVWYDEAVLLLNVMEKDFAGLLGPLHHAVAAPPLFVWLLKLIHLTVGDVSYAWRAVPFAFSVGGLLLTVPLARRVLPPSGAVLAVGLVAVSDNHVWLGCTIKPYAGDAAIATALLLYLRASDGWPAAKRLLVLVAFAPPLICFSYTSMFVFGGVLLAMLPQVWANVGQRFDTPGSVKNPDGGCAEKGDPLDPLDPLALRPRPVPRQQATRGGNLLAWLLASAAVAGTVAVLYFGPMKEQRDPNLFEEWRLHFPNYDNPTSIPLWLGQATLGVFQQACNPSGIVLGLLAPLGVWGLWKAGRREVAIACIGMFGLAIMAAAVKAYPFGQHRLSFFLAPAAVVLGSAGVGEVIRWRRWVGIPLAVLLVAAADGLSLWHLWEPWHRPDARAVQRYVLEHRQPGDVILGDDAVDPKRGNYLYFFHGELKPLAAGAEVPTGGRAWVVMDHHTNAERRAYIEKQIAPLGFELAEEKVFHPTREPFSQAAAYLYVRTK